MDNVLAPVAAKLAKLFPRLASDYDGEVIATVRAIGRALLSAGLDFHALAGALTRISDLTGTGGNGPTWPSSEPQTWQEVARWCRNHDQSRLTPKERQFVRDLAARLVCNGMPTEAQARWLRSIYAKLTTGGRP